MRRGAEVQTDQGSCLSEPQASLHETPAGLSTTGCPQRSGGTQAPGSPFLLLTLLLAKQKKSESPAAATERHRNQAEDPTGRNKTRLRLAQPERGLEGKSFDRLSSNGGEGMNARLRRVRPERWGASEQGFDKLSPNGWGDMASHLSRILRYLRTNGSQKNSLTNLH